MHVLNFKWRRWQPCRWLSGTNNCVKAHVGDVIIVWRNMHDNTEPNAIWLPATLTDTDLNNQGIQVKYRTNGNCNIPATESRLWGTKWYHLFSAQDCMLRRGAFGFFYTTIFNWTFKNCVSSRGSSKGYLAGSFLRFQISYNSNSWRHSRHCSATSPSNDSLGGGRKSSILAANSVYLEELLTPCDGTDQLGQDGDLYNNFNKTGPIDRRYIRHRHSNLIIHIVNYRTHIGLSRALCDSVPGGESQLHHHHLSLL